MKTVNLITLVLSVCFFSQVKAQGDANQTPLQNQDTIGSQFENVNPIPPPYIECSKPQHALMLGKKGTGDLPQIPPGSDDPGKIKLPREGDINIYWIHGLNGSVESWRVAAQATEFGTMDRTFPARKAKSIIGLTGGDQSYLESNGITYASRDMNKVAINLPPTYTHTPDDYIIAHSQGGIVAREWLRNIDENPAQFKDYVHGLVTFGTSHTGAMILNKTRPELENRAPAFIYEACRVLGKAQVEKTIQNKLFLRMVLSDNMKNTIAQTSCSFFSDIILPFALDNYHKETTRDFYVGSPFLTKPSALHPTGLSNYELKVPVVQFYGEEEKPEMWRYFSSMLDLGKDQVLQAGNAAGEFAYDKDNQIQNKVSEAINEFQALQEYEEGAYRRILSWECVTRNPWKWAVPALGALDVAACTAKRAAEALKSESAISAYRDARVWLSNANEYYLADLVGAKVTTTTSYCRTQKGVKQLQCIGGGPLMPRTCHYVWGLRTTEEHPTNGNPCPTSTITVDRGNGTIYVETTTQIFKTTYSYKPNDGVVMVESAAAPLKISSMNPNNTHTYHKMTKTNHDQMKNSQETRKALNKLYEGQLGNFFAINPR